MGKRLKNNNNNNNNNKPQTKPQQITKLKRLKSTCTKAWDSLGGISNARITKTLFSLHHSA